MSPSARPARSEHGRQDLMDIAIDCFAQSGYRATSIDRIARAAGVTKGALYYHFRDKEDLLFEAVRERVGQFERHVLAAVLPADDAEEALRRLARICLDHATKSNHRRFIVTLAVEASDAHNESLLVELREMMNRFRAFLRGIVRTGQEQRVFRPEVDPVPAAALFSGAVMGAEIQYYQNPDDVNLEETLDALLESFLAWLRVPTARRSRGGRHVRSETHG